MNKKKEFEILTDLKFVIHWLPTVDYTFNTFKKILIDSIFSVDFKISYLSLTFQFNFSKNKTKTVFFTRLVYDILLEHKPCMRDLLVGV